MYLNNLGEVDYRFDSDINTTVKFTNLTKYSHIVNKIKDDISLYQYYIIKDGERPDLVSYDLYNTIEYYWTFFILNDNIRNNGWPLSSINLEEFITKKVPGQILTSYGPNIINNFPIGTNVFGSISGATGVVYNRNVTMGQLFVTNTNNNLFIDNEIITDTNVTNMLQYSLNINEAISADLGVFKYIDTDNNSVYVDYLSGNIPDTTLLNKITYREHYIDTNFESSKIRVFKPDIVKQITNIF